MILIDSFHNIYLFIYFIIFIYSFHNLKNFFLVNICYCVCIFVDLLIYFYFRSNAESIAFSNGGNFEFNKSEQQLDQLIAVQIKLIFKKFYLALSIYFFDYAGTIVSFIVIAIPLFAGTFDHISTSDLAQLISQNAFVSIYLINVFTRIIDLSDSFTLIAGTTHRIGQLVEYLNKKKEKFNFERSLSSSSATVNVVTSDGLTYFKLNDVTIQVPNIYRRLTEHLTFGISTGENLLISGPSGSCKTSILRVIKGLWKESIGSIERFLPINDPNIVMFLPQKPTLTIGSLLDVRNCV